MTIRNKQQYQEACSKIEEILERLEDVNIPAALLKEYNELQAAVIAYDNRKRVQ